MYNITLICTVHSEIGKCNSDELLKIIESISPDVIFEELPNSLFDKIYNGNQFSHEFLEVKCIKKYLQNHDIKHIPVDINVNSNISKIQIKFMFDVFKNYHVYEKIEQEQNILTGLGGFEYLNSTKCIETFNKQRNTERKLLELMMNKHQLSHIYKLFHDELDNREYEMLRNIYNYSKENQYNQAVFLIGSAHRNSIMKKITEYKSKEKLELNWKFYNNQDSQHI